MPFIESPNGHIFYHKIGSGPKVIVALHGYERDGIDFLRAIIKKWEKEITLYALDLPYHGATKWTTELYSKSQLKEIISLLIKQEGLSHFTAIGHSLGGRLWLAIAPYFAKYLNDLWLLAPDGLTTRNMNLFEHLPILIRQWLANILYYPKILINIASLVHRLSIIDARAIRFLKHHLSNDDMTQNLIKTWKSIYQFRINRADLEKQLRENHYHTYFVIGERDQVIDIKKMQKLIEGMDNASFILLEQASHQSLISKSFSVMSNHI